MSLTFTIFKSDCVRYAGVDVRQKTVSKFSHLESYHYPKGTVLVSKDAPDFFNV